MAYSVKEMYLTLQGEGAQSGRLAVFLRFAGCNLWSGREADRERGSGGCARWCDTQFVGTDGPGGGRFPQAEELAQAVAALWPETEKQHALVVCTGGEPLLQLDAALVSALHAQGFAIAVETNGTVLPPEGIDWLTVSPKAGAPVKLRRGQELKLVYPQHEEDAQPEHFVDWDFEHFFLQPLDGPDAAANTQAALDYCRAHPRWRLSLQTHKLLNIP